MIIPFQTHGTKILPVDEKFLGASGQQQQEMLNGIDALITTEPGCCICISTADCIPVLLYDRVHHAVAAVHAGWRGTVEYIVGHTLEKMRAVFGTEGQDVIACIGPGISLQSFEVGDEVYETFRLMVLICRVSLSGIRLHISTILTYGKPTGNSFWILEYREYKLK